MLDSIMNLLRLMLELLLLQFQVDLKYENEYHNGQKAASFYLEVDLCLVSSSVLKELLD